MPAAIAGTPMTWDEVERTADAFKMGVLPMKAVAWQLHLYHENEGGKAEARELSKLCESTENSAHRALQSIRIYANTKQQSNIFPNRKDATLSKVTPCHLDESSSRHLDTPPPPDVSPPTPPPSFPPPPGVCVSAPASAHAHEAEPEPFIADDPTPLPDDEWVEVERQVTRLANSTHAGEQAEAAGRAGMWPKSWLIEAATETGAKRIGAMGAWKYMRKILLRWEAAGASDMDAERAEARAIAATAPPSIPIRASPAANARELERLARIAEWEADESSTASRGA